MKNLNNNSVPTVPLSHVSWAGTLGQTTPIAMSHYYALQKYTNPSSRHTCPACGRPRCFILYIDPEGNPLHGTVGRCDHESTCAYHYTPRQYFRDHPQHRPDRSHYHHDRHHCHSERPSVIPSERSEGSFTRHARPDRASPYIIPRNLIPPPSGSNHLITYLKTMLPSSAIDRIIADYPHLDLKVSDLLEKHATPKHRAAHIDLADWILKYLEDDNA